MRHGFGEEDKDQVSVDSVLELKIWKNKAMVWMSTPVAGNLAPNVIVLRGGTFVRHWGHEWISLLVG